MGGPPPYWGWSLPILVAVDPVTFRGHDETIGNAVPVTVPGQLSELLERAGALESLGDSLRTVERSSRGRVVLVSGGAGIGKTALLRRFCEDSRPTARILWGNSDPLFTPRPLGPLIVVAESTGGAFEEVVRSRALPHEVVAALGRELRGPTASVLVLEDVHWADEATLDVIRLLVRRMESVPTLVIASYRDDELDGTDAFRRVLGELATNTGVRRVRLAPLSPTAVARLAEPHRVDADRLYEKTGGTPFFVVEALAASGEEIPATVRDAVLARAALLSPAARAVLDAVAVVPQRVELWLLEAMVEELDGLDEGLAGGMLTSEPGGVAFRHELARLAIEESVGPGRKLGLHRRALAALCGRSGGVADLARAAHHAEAAGDVEAVLRFASAAAAEAASMGAHREAAAQYGRALRFGDGLALVRRAELCELRSRECYLTDHSDEAIEAIERALSLRRMLGDKLAEGNALRWLSQILWCPGRTGEAERAALHAVAILEAGPQGRELAMAYANLAATCVASARIEESIAWARRALELAERLGDTETAVHALSTIGLGESGETGTTRLLQALERAQQAELPEQAGKAFSLLALMAVGSHRQAAASRYIAAGIDYCSDNGQELYRLYLLAYRSRLELDQGRWSDAADSATAVLRIPRTSTTPRITALVVLGLVRARRGDPGHRAALEEAWALAEPTGELPRLGPVAAARAEAAWLQGDRHAVDLATAAALPLALERSSKRHLHQLGLWRWRAGLDTDTPAGLAKPYERPLAGDSERTARRWSELGCPYEAALALADDDEETLLRRALEELQRLEARPAAAIIARRLRERGARAVPRGPRPTTAQNPYNLTRRQLEVLALVTAGLRNPQIADKLVLSVRTVEHHVEAILTKLGVSTRIEICEMVTNLGPATPDGPLNS